MLDVSKYLAERLKAAGIPYPACEEPMLEEQAGPYVTWAVGTCKERWASGRAYERVYPVSVTLWFPLEFSDWRQALWAIADALDGGVDAGRAAEKGVRCYSYGITGAEDAPTIGRRCARVSARVHESAWE